MKLVSLDAKELKKYTVDPEMLQKAKRPCALIIKLKYKGSFYDFAIPIRSNISPNTPKCQYYPLPTRHTTKDTYRHGVHFIKMFPVDRTKVNRFNMEGMFYQMMKAFLDKEEKNIVKACQNYLLDYELGNKPKYATNIDLLINVLNK